MLKVFLSLAGEKKSWCILFVLLVLFQAMRMHSLKTENQKLLLENEKYQELCLDFENKLKAQTALTESAIKREQKNLKNETERRQILKAAKPQEQKEKEIIDHETRKKVIARLNRSL